MRIVVLGGSGYVGSRLVAELVARGHQVVAGVRSRPHTTFGWEDRVRVVRVDLDDPVSVRRVLDAVDVVDVCYYLVHGIGQPGYEERDRVHAQRFAESASRAGVRRIVYLGGFVPAPSGSSPHLRARAAVGTALGDSTGVDLVWLRAAVIIGAGSVPFEITRYLADRCPIVPLPEWVDNRMDPISIRDVLYYLVAAAEPDLLPAGSYDIRGPDTGRYRDLLFTYLRQTRLPRFAVTLPWVQPRVAGWIGGHLAPVPAALTAGLMRSLDCPMSASEDRIRELVPEPAGGLQRLSDTVAESARSPYPVAVTALADPRHLALCDPLWAGGDRVRLQRHLRRSVEAPLSVARTVVDQAGAGIGRGFLDTQP